MKEEYLRRAGKRVKELRDELGLSTRGFGKKIGFSNSYVSNIENGVKLPTMNVLTKISEAFDVDLAYFLLDETDEPISEDKEWYLFGKELEALYNVAKANNFAIPAVNTAGTDTINAAIETAAKVKSPIIIQFSNGGSHRI